MMPLLNKFILSNNCKVRQEIEKIYQIIADDLEITEIYLN